MNADPDTRPPDLLVVLGGDVIAITVIDLGPAPELTPAGRIRRTRAEIQAEAQRKRDELQAKRDRKAAASSAKKAAKQLRAQARHERSQAAEMKRIERERKRRNREVRGRYVIVPKPETPRHVFAERLQDDPDKSNWNHVVDESTLDYEDMLIARLDGELVDEEADGDSEDYLDALDEAILAPEHEVEEDYSSTAYSDDDNATSERMPRWTGHWDDERQPTRLGRRGRNITVIRQRCPHSGKVIVEVPKPMLRTSKDLLIAAK